LERRKFRKFLGAASEILTSVEGAVIDLHIGILSINSSALDVACGPPGIGAKI
jgi:hypothetical protein